VDAPKEDARTCAKEMVACLESVIKLSSEPELYRNSLIDEFTWSLEAYALPLRRKLERFLALEQQLPAGYAIGDDATAELAVKLIGAESESAALRQQLQDCEGLISDVKTHLVAMIDRDDKHELPLPTLAIVAENAMYWRNEEIRKLRERKYSLEDALRKVTQMAVDQDSDGWSDKIEAVMLAALEEKP
jgi:hypothetical protein